MEAAAGAREASLLQSFIALLDAEEQALLAGDPERIEQLAGEKLECVKMLSRYSLPAAPGARLLHLRDEARTRNARNGGLIAMRRARVQERLTTLSAQASEGALYGADGRFRARPTP